MSSAMPELGARQISALLGSMEAGAVGDVRQRSRSMDDPIERLVNETEGAPSFDLSNSAYDTSTRKRLSHAIADLKGVLLYDVLAIIAKLTPGAVQKSTSSRQWSFDVRMLNDQTIETVNEMLKKHAPMSGHSSILASENMKILSDALDLGSGTNKRKRKASNPKTASTSKVVSKRKKKKSNTDKKAQKVKKSDETSFDLSGILIRILKPEGEKRRKLQCTKCDKIFRTKGEVRAHVRTHTGEKPLKCKYCDKRFAHSSNRRVHERTHLKQKPFKCVECGKGFAHKATLKEHMTIHTGTFPFHCDICGKGFRSRSNMSKHKKRLHGSNE